MKKTKKFTMISVLMAFAAVLVLLPSTIIAGELEPTAPPGPTMKTLDQIPPTWSQILPCDDAAACPRFELVMGGAAVLDKETGLTWVRNAFRIGQSRSWHHAILDCAFISHGDRLGWKLPTREELASLLDMSSPDTPKLPSGHPFTNVLSNRHYWSSTEYDSNLAWSVNMDNGNMFNDNKISPLHVWCVRGGN